jgi:hypothetical protein
MLVVTEAVALAAAAEVVGTEAMTVERLALTTTAPGPIRSIHHNSGTVGCPLNSATMAELPGW